MSYPYLDCTGKLPNKVRLEKNYVVLNVSASIETRWDFEIIHCICIWVFSTTLSDSVIYYGQMRITDFCSDMPAATYSSHDIDELDYSEGLYPGAKFKEGLNTQLSRLFWTISTKQICPALLGWTKVEAAEVWRWCTNWSRQLGTGLAINLPWTYFWIYKTWKSSILKSNRIKSYICGVLSIVGLTEHACTIRTFFSGEIIGPDFSFLTRKWEADYKKDLEHWR